MAEHGSFVGIPIVVTADVAPLTIRHENGLLIIGTGVDIRALIFCLQLSAEDREWLRGMYVGIGLEPARPA